MSLDASSGADPPTLARDAQCRLCGIDRAADDLNSVGVCRSCVARADQKRHTTACADARWAYWQSQRELRAAIEANRRKWRLYRRSVARDAARRAAGLDPIPPHRRRQGKQRRHLNGYAPTTQAETLQGPPQALVEADSIDLQRAIADALNAHGIRRTAETDQTETGNPSP